MDRDDCRKNFSRDLESQDSYDTRQAKQRASIKWLLSKAYNNRVPENLREPFYRDHEDQEHLKPQIVHNLANAELYCLAFANIYSDPNYHNLNHWGILQTLSRKGITVPDPPDGPLTETVLIQTTPIKLGAHMAVIEATMVLYAKEVVTPDRVVAAIHRFSHGHENPDLPQDFEDGLLLWVNHSQKALTQRIQMDFEKEGGDPRKVPRFPEVKDIKGLCDGAGIAALISFYCPEELPWTDIKIPYLPTVSDSVHNLCLVHEFSHHSLPFTVCHMMPEDVTYLRGNMKQNLIVLLADLFNVLEIHPVKCVRFPGYERNKELSKPTSIITSGIRKSHSSPHSDSYFRGSPDSLDRSDDRRSEDSFVVHRNRGVPTLSSVGTEDQSMSSRMRTNKERTNQDTKADERGELSKAAGKPSNWEENKRSSYAGRRSRRNSLSEDSQLTLENFGGSQENLYFIGRNPDKELTHVSGRLDGSSLSSSPSPSVPLRTSIQDARSCGVELIFAENELANSQPVQRRDSRKSPSPAPPVVVQNVPVRSSQQDARSNAIDRIFADNGYGIEKHDEEKTAKQESLVSLKNLIHSKQANDLHNDVIDGESNMRTANFPDSKIPEMDMSYNDDDSENYLKPQKSSLVNRKPGMQTNGNEKKTTFAALPNTTTWQQQKTANNINNLQEVPNIPVDETSNMQLHNIRLKLEEKRRVIENEKRKMELLMSKQRQKLGKAAFLQAVTKDKIKSDSKSGNSSNPNVELVDSISSGSKPQRPFSFQDIKEDAQYVERKWLDGPAPFIEERKTPDLENLDLEQYQNSIAQMNSSLKELDADMQRLSNQQTQLQGLADEFRLNQQHKQYTTLSNQHQHQQFVNQQQYANQVTLNNYTNQNSKPTPNYSTYSNSSPPSKPISLSQLHQQTQNQNQFFLHDQQQTHRRTWSQQHQERTSWSQQAERSDRNVPQPFTFHDSKLQNGGSHPTPSPRSVNTSPMHTVRPTPPPKPIVPPRQTPSTSNMYPAPLPTPSVDDMEPQSICFIGDAPGSNQGIENINLGMSHINITSGSRTYRIPSPTRPSVIKNPFVQKSSNNSSNRTLEETPTVPVDPIDDQPIEKGFYISFDDEAPPKRPKPPLRGKRSPKKERFATQVIESPFEERDKEDQGNISRPDVTPRSVSHLRESSSHIEYSPESAPSLSNTRLEASPLVRKVNDNSRVEGTPSREAEPASPSVGLIIGSEPDPNAIDEMERKKEKILMLSLQRRQQQEELKARKEMEAAQRREIEKMKEEDRARKKEEEKARRAAILEQYKLKKAIEEAEREGKVLDKSDLAKLTTPKLRNKTSTTPRPRPKTIHVESGGMEDGMLTPSRGKKGSTTNLAERTHENAVFSRPLRRDQYRGSQDSLASSAGGRRGFRDSPSDDGRGSSPSRVSSSNLGRRGSYKTSRDTSEPPSQTRGRSKYSTYQSNFRGRKSNSLMNLCGSSSDQDSIAFRYGDTDSGLGRATPPRRAPSPGITSGRHLTSPSGPGSLPPGLISKRRIFDDGASDISSNASSMMEYTGPRLYKQPATKSNRGIMLNAVEYCVFPGAVNKEAKRRVLEEVSRSESKYFLILFRDAGCQFRALYSYCPDTEEVLKLYGTGPKQVNDKMFDKFFKYNSGGKCFSQVHTKHLTVTIDAFTIHNSLWQGKKVNLPSKKDMALVI